MAEATTLIKSADESAKDFNDRLQQIWTDGDNPIGDATLYIVGDQPMVVMTGALDAATEDDVESGRAEEVDEPVMASNPVGCMFCKIIPDQAEKTEARLDKIFDLAGGAVVDVQVVTGDTYAWVKNPNGGEAIYLPAKITYALVVWEVEPVTEDDEGEGDTTDDDDDPKPAKSAKPAKEVKVEVVKKEEQE